MHAFTRNPIRKGPAVFIVALSIVLALALASPTSAFGDKKKKKPDANAQPAAKPQFDISKLVWPSPPSIGRVRYLAYYAGMKIDYTQMTTKQKQSWMDRLAGAQSANEKVTVKNFPYQLLGPYGIAIDSKGLVYVADQKVGAVFIFNTETRDVQLIRNGYEAHFGWINGLAIDDDDRLFVSDGKMHRVLVFNTKHVVEAQIADKLVDPVGLALDTENRFLYVVDTQQDQVIVFDADSLKELRRIGTGGKNHFLTTPGDFGGPQDVALDKDGNVYVTDTMNNRVEIFDADGKFISEFGRHCDGPGCFARPKGIAVDGDGHIWVADTMNDTLQAFNREGQLLTYLGGHGHFPGQFEALVGVAIDKQNRIFTTEQYPGRMQMFRYVTDDEAAAEKTRQEEERKKQAEARRQAAQTAPPETPAATPQKPSGAPTPKPPANDDPPKAQPPSGK
ncbi:MAG: SMP-30/gluconolactonase/LRE family protein [Candidatus Sulfotelmatobacter sp.]